jgi:hypothetical protein
MKFKKAIAGTELIILIIVLVLIPVSVTIAGTVFEFLRSENPEDVASIRSFERLNQEINKLLEDPGAYAYKEHLPITLSERHVIVGFDRDSDYINIINFGEQPFNRPSSCFGACLCLIKATNKRGSRLEKKYDLNNALCENYNQNISFYSLSQIIYAQEKHYFSSRDLDSYYREYERGSNVFLKSYGRLRNENFFNFNLYDFSIFSKELKNNLGDFYERIVKKQNPRFNNYFNFLFLAGRQPQYDPDKTFLFNSQTIFIDKLDTNLLNSPNDNIYLFFTLSSISDEYENNPIVNFFEVSSFPDSAKSGEGLYKNIFIDFRKLALDHLRYRNSNSIASNIRLADNPEQKLYYFLDYLYWVMNPHLHEIEDGIVDSMIYKLGAPVIQDIMVLIEDRKKYCQDYSQNEDIVKDCFYFNCSININNLEYCNKLNNFMRVGKENDLMKHLYGNVTKWHAVLQDKQYELIRLLSEIRLESDLEKQYLLFLNYAQEYNLDSEKDFPNDLVHFKEAFVLYELNNTNSDKNWANKTINIDENEIEVILIIFDEINYLYLKDKYINKFSVENPVENFYSDKFNSFFEKNYNSYIKSKSDDYVIEQIKLIEFRDFHKLEDSNILEDESEEDEI